MWVFTLKRKESTPLVDLSSRAWVICQLPGQNWRFRALSSPCAGPAVNESRKCCWRKQPAAASKKHHTKPALQHDKRLDYFLLLDCFLLLQPNRKRAAFN